MTHLLGQDDLDTGEEVSQRILQRKGNRYTPDTECGDRRRDVDAEVLEDDEEAQHPDRDPSEVDHQRRRLDRPARAA